MTAFRALLLMIATAGLVTGVDARPAKHGHQAKRVVRPDPSQIALTSDAGTRLAQWRAARWGLAGNDLLYDDGQDPDAVSFRWRLNKVKMKVPFSTAP